MSDYRRAFAPGGTFFFTLVTEGRAGFLCEDVARTCLRAAAEQTAERWPFEVFASVLLPDHLHTIWVLPPGDSNFARRWAFLKLTFTKMWLARGGQEQQVSHSREKNRRRGVWQRRYWEHLIRDDRDLEMHCNYIHHNPVKHGLASCPHGWEFSTFRQLAQQGYYAPDWQCVCDGRRPQRLCLDGFNNTAAE